LRSATVRIALRVIDSKHSPEKAAGVSTSGLFATTIPGYRFVEGAAGAGAVGAAGVVG
jgi:hypothetical protein